MNLKFCVVLATFDIGKITESACIRDCSKSVRKYSPCIVQCQQPFHIFSIRCQSIEKLHRKYRSCKAKRTGSASPPRFAILNSF